MPEGPVHVKIDEQCALLHKVTTMRLNLVVLYLDSLRALLQGVAKELRIREQRALSAFSEMKVNNQKMFTKNM